MTAAVFSGKRPGFLFRTENLAPLAVEEGDLIAVLQDLERLCYRAHGIKADGIGLVELLKVSGIDKVAHGDAIHIEAQRFHRVSALIGVNQTAVRPRGHEIDGWINQ